MQLIQIAYLRYFHIVNLVRRILGAQKKNNIVGIGGGVCVGDRIRQQQ